VSQSVTQDNLFLRAIAAHGNMSLLLYVGVFFLCARHEPAFLKYLLLVANLRFTPRSQFNLKYNFMTDLST